MTTLAYWAGVFTGIAATWFGFALAQAAGRETELVDDAEIERWFHEWVRSHRDLEHDERLN